MADNNIGTLFHFTKNLTTLQKILMEGFRITYCKEHFQDSFMGIPMVSFCDIPLSRTDQHKKDYGIYVIGLDKDKLLANKDITYLNPVIYCHSEILANSLNSHKKEYEDMQTNIAKRTQDTEHPNVKIDTSGSIGTTLGMFAKSSQIKYLPNSLLGFTKPYAGPGGKGRKIIYYNEREWRFVIPEGIKIDDKPCRWLNEEEYNEWRGNIKEPKKLFNTILPIGVDYITHLIVDQETTIPSLINYIWKSEYLFGHIVDDRQKRILISRITSFQRIKKDY